MFFPKRPHAGLPSRTLVVAFAIAASVACGTAAADDFPSHAIKFVVPFVPGSITDIAARYYAKRLGEETGQPVVVENKAGGNGLIGVSAVLNAPHDGYTMLVGTTSILATNAALYRALPYDPLKDLAALGMMASVPSVIAVPAGSERANMEALVKAGRARPDSLNYSAGATSYQLMGELLQEKASFTARAIPYKGVGAALNALIGKEVDFSIIDATSALGSVQGGTIQALAVASKERLALLPNVPTTAEAGLPDFVASTWVAAVAPAQVPAARLAKLEQLFAKTALRTRQKEEIELWSRIVKSAKIEQL
ncbi:MAG: hypothetical protein ABS43_25045 [Bordetella sp. SCN 67-23]|nr:MAG: hypothetical protein ABS43_25045 [Bordetella sp. SCN 67-23]